ncbi:cytokine-induced anti-apoptosis inhibitor 1, Fe-S biogenesis-domain-containing protein [Dipodascopsis tothii]|uniref:cytokine-induced anti-apoptosis inhibitor 1, Fe-S biogenesis-domain-containing protein n=1 Tax=Dipodascopsis tothii TaxID=44089 RepID=UPI0034CF4065
MNVLVLAHPSLAAQPQTLAQTTAGIEARGGTRVTLQMMDRLPAVALPSRFYGEIVVAPAGTPLGGAAIQQLATALAPQGTISGAPEAQGLDAMACGLMVQPAVGGGWQWSKPAEGGSKVVSLRRPARARAEPPALVAASNSDSDSASSAPSAAGSPERGWGATLDEDEDMIDEDALLDDVDDVAPALQVPEACAPGGKRRRKACKDCTCGLKELEEAAEAAAREARTVALTADETAEIDFTVEGKTGGSCGNCALGDAFRCDGCPYLGLPPFKPGEVVSIDALGDDDL